MQNILHLNNGTSGLPRSLFTMSEENRLREKISQYRKDRICGYMRMVIGENSDSFTFVTDDGHELFVLYRNYLEDMWYTYGTYGSVHDAKDPVADNIDEAVKLMR